MSTCARSHRTHRLLPPLGLAVLALVLLLTHAQPVDAGYDASKVGFRNYHACSNDGERKTLYVRTYMKEYGKSGVTRHKAKFRLYRADNGYGLYEVSFDKTYVTGYFPNDTSSYGGYVPTGGDHAWRDLIASIPFRIEAKLTWERPWRRDWSTQELVKYC